jgi:hypothetical protein
MNLAEYYQTQMANTERILAEAEEQAASLNALIGDLRGEVERYRQKLNASTNGGNPHIEEPSSSQVDEGSRAATMMQIVLRQGRREVDRKQLMKEIKAVLPDISNKYVDTILSRLKRQEKIKSTGRGRFLVKGENNKPIPPAPQTDNGQSREVKRISIAECVRNLSKNHKRLLMRMVKAGGRMPSQDLIDLMGFKSANQLSGLIATIHRSANAAGLEPGMFFNKRNLSDDYRVKKIEYFIPAHAMDEVREGLGL